MPELYQPGTLFGSQGKATKRFSRQLYGEIPERRARTGTRQEQYDQALDDPTGTADIYGDYFQRAAEGYSKPALRDFNKSISGVSANAARRFGGNISSEELRLDRNASDDFSRNLTEALARLAPAQVEAGQRHTAQLGEAASGAATEEDRLKMLVLQALAGSGGKGIDWGKIIGTGVGIAAAASSLRYKEDVADVPLGTLSAEDLTRLLQLRPVTYRYKGSQVTQLGLVAEEVAEVAPEFVVYDEQGRPDAVQYGALVVTLLRAIKVAGVAV